MDDLALIRLVKSNEHLYDKNNKHYKSFEMRKATWQMIARELGFEEIDPCMRRWTSIRDRYTRGSRRLTALANDGIETDVPPLFKEMEFLKPHIVPRCTSILKDSSFSLTVKALPPTFNPDSFTTDLEDTKEYEEVTVPFQFMNSASNESIQEKEEEEEIDALLPTNTLSPSAFYPKSPRDEPKAFHLPVTKSKNQRKSSRKRHYESDIEQELSSALQMFKQVCGAAKARHENPAIHGFGQMIVETICGMSERKQTIAMQKVTEVVMKLKIEPEAM